MLLNCFWDRVAAVDTSALLSRHSEIEILKKKCFEKKYKCSHTILGTAQMPFTSLPCPFDR